MKTEWEHDESDNRSRGSRNSKVSYGVGVTVGISFRVGFAWFRVREAFNDGCVGWGQVP